MPPLPFTPPLPPLRHHPLNHRLLSSPLSTRPHTHTAINSDTTEWDPSMVSPARIDPFYTPSSTAPTTTTTPTTTTKPAEGIFTVSFIDPPPAACAPPKRKRAPAPTPSAPPSPTTPPKKRRKPPTAPASDAACTAAAVVAGITAVASTITAAATNTLSAATSTLSAATATASTLLALTTTTTTATTAPATAAAALPLIDLYRAHAQRRPHSRGMSILHTKLPYIGERALLDLDFAGSEADGVMGAAEMRALVDSGEGSGEWARLESVVRDREVGGVCRRVVRFVEWS